MGIKGLTKLLSDNTPKAMKQQKFQSYFGRKITIARVTNSIEKIKAAKDKSIQGRVESFFKPVSTSTSTSISIFLQSRHMSYSVTLPVTSSSVDNSSLALNFLNQSSRGYAKGRRQPRNVDEDDDDDDGEEPQEDDKKAMQIVNIGPSVKADALSQMEAAIDALSRELLKLRTGRASSGMIDHIIVQSGGVKNPLNRMAVVSVIDPKTLSITPFDPNTLKELEKAIVSSPLGLNPKSDNQRLIASIPPLTKEHMQAVCKVVAKSSEDAKQRIRRARQKAFDTIKKALPKKMTEGTTKKGKDKAASHSNKKDKKDKDNTVPSFSVDDAKRLEKEIDEFTKKFIKSAEDMCKAKEKEITTS